MTRISFAFVLLVSIPSWGQKWVQTPGGYIPKSHVYELKENELLRVEKGLLQIFDAKCKCVIRTLKEKYTGFPLTRAWIADTRWDNHTGSPISYFETSWKVPKTPSINNGQLVYYFNGIMPANHAAILQPVLQWGVSPAGGGSYWAIASWYVTSTGHAVHSKLLRVNEGQDLKGVMTLTGENGGKFSYKSEFVGINGTSLVVQNVPELTQATEALEAYGISQCSNYPGLIGFSGIGIKTANQPNSIQWDAVFSHTGCGHQIDIVSNSASDGLVNIYMK